MTRTIRSATLFPVLCLLLHLSCAKASRRPGKFTLDYAKDPVSRWDGALAMAVRDRSWDETWGTIFSYHNRSVFDYVSAVTFDRIGQAVSTNYPDRAAELRGIAAQFAELYPDQIVSYEYLAAWAYYHELAHSDVDAQPSASSLESKKSRQQSCTGLLAADASGKVHHVANMDQSPNEIKGVTLHVEFINSSRSTEVLFQGVDWYWFSIGTTRMVMPGVVSVQENWRTDHTLPLGDVLEDIDRGVVPQTWVFRQTLERVVRDPSLGDFEELVQHFSTMPLGSPYFITMAGPGKMQGAVIARDNQGVPAPGGVLRLGDEDGNPTTPTADADMDTDVPVSSWALVQTNYDHWVEDNPKDPRRKTAEHLLANAGQEEGATELGLYAVATTYPVHNPTTAYTAVMDPETGTMHAFVRVAMCPVGDKECQELSKANGFGGSGDGAWSSTYLPLLGQAKLQQSRQQQPHLPEQHAWNYLAGFIVSLMAVIAAMAAVKVSFIRKRNEIGSSRVEYESVP